MQANPKKVKLVLFLAIALAVVLFVCSICLIVNINIKQKQILNQQTEITKLNNQLNYYQNQKDLSDDSNITVEE